MDEVSPHGLVLFKVGKVLLKHLPLSVIEVLNKPRARSRIFQKKNKMYFSLLSKILSPEEQYNVYLDIKRTPAVAGKCAQTQGSALQR